MSTTGQSIQESSVSGRLRFRMPAEWEPQQTLWFSWPTAPHLWSSGRLARVQAEILRIAAIVSSGSCVGINGVQADDNGFIQLVISTPGFNRENLQLSGIPCNDSWCRDHGPTFVEDQIDRTLAGIDWNFNAWGAKYKPWNEDNRVARRMLEWLELPRLNCPFIGEGGGLEVSGDGVVMLSESVWLNSNRNPDASKRDIETWLFKHLGCHEALWFTEGLAHDDTDGHVDMFARFINTNSLVICQERHSHHPQYRSVQQLREQAYGFRTPTCGHYDFMDLPMPDPAILDGSIFPSSYANFLVFNEWVIVPQYGQPRNDALALGILQECFPGRRAIGMDCSDCITEGGAIHCLTQQQPIAVVSK